jgi:hypothetical protein
VRGDLFDTTAEQAPAEEQRECVTVKGSGGGGGGGGEEQKKTKKKKKKKKKNKGLLG